MMRRALVRFYGTTAARRHAARLSRTTVTSSQWVRALSSRRAPHTKSSPSSSSPPPPPPTPPASEEETVVDAQVVDVDDATPHMVGHKQKHSFQAETRQILDIVAKSLYTDKEVFLRELISNASDALEKCRYWQSTDHESAQPDRPMEIHIKTNTAANTLTIQDYGIGMSESELRENLGVIARSGSKQFVKALQEAKSTGSGADTNIIGQFGVGFYSAFMVADRVEVYTQSADGENPPMYWSSEGSGDYEISEVDHAARGVRIVLHLREDCKSFSYPDSVETIIKKYSNFVGFPIVLNGNKLNTISAIWAKRATEVTEDEHVEFYRYVSGAYDSPLLRLHFTTDVPIAIQALFYVPQNHTEKFGMGRMEPGVSLYSRKVLIKSKSKEILPDWLRFVKGVVDCEDIPLNISRENMQDSALIARLKNVLVRKLVRYFEDMAKKEPEQFIAFYNEFNPFLKEGVCTDSYHKDSIARLLRFESSTESAGQLASFDEYISRMKPEQKDIFFLVAPDRHYAQQSPYFEVFREKKVEVLFLYQDVDDFVMRAVETYSKRKLVSIESAGASEFLGTLDANKSDEETKKEAAEAMPDDDVEAVIKFLTDALSESVSSVKATTRLANTPAIVVDHESASMRKMMKYVDQKFAHGLPKQKMEINPKHEVIKGLLAASRGENRDVAVLVAHQVFDNALMAADILENPRAMIPRINRLLQLTLKTSSQTPLLTPPPSDTTTK